MFCLQTGANLHSLADFNRLEYNKNIFKWKKSVKMGVQVLYFKVEGELLFSHLSLRSFAKKQTNNRKPKPKQGMRAASESQRQSNFIRIVCFASLKIKSISHSSNK